MVPANPVNLTQALGSRLPGKVKAIGVGPNTTSFFLIQKRSKGSTASVQPIPVSSLTAAWRFAEIDGRGKFANYLIRFFGDCFVQFPNFTTAVGFCSRLSNISFLHSTSPFCYRELFNLGNSPKKPSLVFTSSMEFRISHIYKAAHPSPSRPSFSAIHTDR